MNYNDPADDEDRRGFLPVDVIASGLWHARALVLACALAGMACAALYLLLTHPTYTARATLTQPAGGDPSPASATSGLAALVGVRIGGSDITTTFEKFVQITRSSRLAAALEEKHHVMRVIFPGWDEASHKFQPPSGLGAVRQLAKRMLGLPAWQPPNAVSLAQYLTENITVASSPNADGPTDQTKLISFIYDNPAFARDFLRMVIETADEVVRNDKLVNERNRIDYLDRTLAKTQELYLRESLSQLLQNEQRAMMVLQADRYYAFDMVDPPVVDNVPTAPKPTFMLLAGFLVGLMVGSTWAFILIRRRAIASGGCYNPGTQPFPNPFMVTRRLLRPRRTGPTPPH